MCGIVGYTGKNTATNVLLSGLSNLEYRGYDSSGVSVFSDTVIKTVKSKGRLCELEAKLEGKDTLLGTCGIGHTRWATHGEPSDRNSHPHTTEKISLVHNGIIENYLDLKNFLSTKGYVFASETDTEAAVLLLDYLYDNDPESTIKKALEKIEGSYAFAVMFRDFPDTIYAVRCDSPLLIGLGEGENYLASDMPAILEYTRDYHLLEEGEIAKVTPNGVTVRDFSGNIVEKERFHANWTLTQAQKGGYSHFMLKEIHEQPKVLDDTISPRIEDGLPSFADDGITEEFFTKYKKLFVVACGTAAYAGMVGKSLAEKLARLPVEVDLASEFRYRNPILTKSDLVVIISQSGETADSLAALRLAKSQGISVLAIVNVTGSSIAREADYVIHTYAGPEIAVASTKAYSVQLAVMYLLAISFGYKTGQLDEQATRDLTKKLVKTAEMTSEILGYSDELAEIARAHTDTRSMFYLGRGLDHSLAMEGALKLKEVSYIHAEEYAAGELKHGTISLITENVPVVGILTQSELLSKTVSNIKETKTRGASVFLITREDFEVEAELYDHIIRLPATDDIFTPVLAAIVLQLFAYHVAVVRGCDVDKPRNLAKSVTVE